MNSIKVILWIEVLIRINVIWSQNFTLIVHALGPIEGATRIVLLWAYAILELLVLKRVFPILGLENIGKWKILLGSWRGSFAELYLLLLLLWFLIVNHYLWVLESGHLRWIILLWCTNKCAIYLRRLWLIMSILIKSPVHDGSCIRPVRVRRIQNRHGDSLVQRSLPLIALELRCEVRSVVCRLRKPVEYFIAKQEVLGRLGIDWHNILQEGHALRLVASLKHLLILGWGGAPCLSVDRVVRTRVQYPIRVVSLVPLDLVLEHWEYLSDIRRLVGRIVSCPFVALG